MSEVIAWRNKIAEIYSEKSRIIDIVLRFILGLIVFSYIGRNIGFMESLDKMVVTLALTVVCSFVPLTCMIIIASLITLLHVYAASMVLAGCTAVVILLLYIVFFRFAPKYSIVLLLTPIALGLHIPYVLPIACGLLLGPAAAVATTCGTIVYYMISIISEMSETISGDGLDAMLAEAIAFGEQFLKCKEMIYYSIVIIVALCVVTALKHIEIEHAWKIAAGAGCIVSLISAIIIDTVLSVEISFIGLLFGNILAMAVGLVLEVIFMNIDFKKLEVLEFEDDDYHYYVKAVPKIQANKKKFYEDEYEEVESLDDIEEIGELEEKQDIDLAQYDATMVIDTDSIERELRYNARYNERKINENQNQHMEANYRMLHDSIRKDRR